MVSVCTTAAPCPADPSRVAVAPLGEVWAWPACAELRGRLAQEAGDGVGGRGAKAEGAISLWVTQGDD